MSIKELLAIINPYEQVSIHERVRAYEDIELVRGYVKELRNSDSLVKYGEYRVTDFCSEPISLEDYLTSRTVIWIRRN